VIIYLQETSNHFFRDFKNKKIKKNKIGKQKIILLVSYSCLKTCFFFFIRFSYNDPIAPPKSLDEEEIQFIRDLESRKLQNDKERKEQHADDLAQYCKSINKKFDHILDCLMVIHSYSSRALENNEHIIQSTCECRTTKFAAKRKGRRHIK
jgi:hypothetical protein